MRLNHYSIRNIIFMMCSEKYSEQTAVLRNTQNSHINHPIISQQSFIEITSVNVLKTKYPNILISPNIPQCEEYSSLLMNGKDLHVH